MFPYKFLKPNVQALSFAVTRVQLFDERSCIGVGTAYFDKFGEKTYLITNWHCVTGRIPSNGRARSNDGRTPLSLVVLIPRSENGVLYYLNPVQYEVPVEFGPGSPWRMHPSGQKVDVVIHEVREGLLVPARVSCVSNNHSAIVQAGSEVFILGFPQGLQPTGTLPIWKRGSIATEPSVEADNEPCFWIDSATREGMSGSPVFVRRPSSSPSNFDDPELHSETLIVPSQHLVFCGVYSGRMSASDPLEAQIGKVWRPECLKAILDSGIPLNYEEY